jgi:hypothetical protein
VNIGSVLDTSAILAYSRGSDAIGELLLLLREEARALALPVVALADAFGHTDDGERGMLELLMSSPAILIVPLDPRTVAKVGGLGRRIGLGPAHAATVAAGLDNYLFTANPKAFEGVLREDLIIEI